MKKLLSSAVFLLTELVCSAGSVELSPLPPREFADTEVSTNCPFDVLGPDLGHFKFVLELAGTPSNNVEVSFGRDLDRDGSISLSEAGLTVGWDCGRWFMHGSAAGTNEWMTAEAATSGGRKCLDWDLLVMGGKARRLSCRENDRDVSWPAFGIAPAWTYDGAWDTVKLTVRGVDAPNENFRAKVFRVGTTIMIR